MQVIRLQIHEGPYCFPADLHADPLLEKWRDPKGREFGFGLDKGGRLLIRLYNCGAFVVQPGYREVLGFLDPGVEEGRFRETFLHLVAPWILQRHDWECLHASAVLTDVGVVAFSGPSGRGKSTIARACGELGTAPYADDAVPFLFRNGLPMAACIPQPLRLREPAASWFGDAVRLQRVGAGGDEILYDLAPTLRPLVAIYWLEPGDGAPVIERTPMLDSFRLLLSQAYSLSLLDRACNRKMVNNYLSLSRLAPVFRFAFPVGRTFLPGVLDRLHQHWQGLFGTGTPVSKNYDCCSAPAC